MFFKDFIYLFIFKERGREGEGEEEGDNHQCVVASRVPPTGDLDPLVHRPVLNPLSHTSQG